MRRCLVVVITVFAATLIAIPRASAGDAPIGHLGDTLRVDTGKMIADITVSSVQPVDPPPGFGYNRVGVPVKSFPNSAVMRADVAIHAVRVPNPHQMVTDFTFDGVTPFGDAYKSRTPMHPTRWTRRWRTHRQGRSCAAACTGRPTAIRWPPLCCWTRRRVITWRSGTCSSDQPRRIPSTSSNWLRSPHAPFRWPVPRRSRSEDIASFIDRQPVRRAVRRVSGRPATARSSPPARRSNHRLRHADQRRQRRSRRKAGLGYSGHSTRRRALEDVRAADAARLWRVDGVDGCRARGHRRLGGQVCLARG